MSDLLGPLGSAIATAIAGQTPNTPVAATGPVSISLGTITAIGTDGTLTATMNGASITCKTMARDAYTVADVIRILTYDNLSWADGVVGTTQSMDAGFQPGDIMQTFATAASRPGWLACDGSSYLIATYPRLAAAMGKTGTSFNVPDARGRFLVGANGTYVLNTPGGSTTIASTNLPVASPWSATQAAHSHSLNSGVAPIGSFNGGQGGSGGTVMGVTSMLTAQPVITMGNNASGGQAYNPPHLPVNRFIKT